MPGARLQGYQEVKRNLGLRHQFVAPLTLPALWFPSAARRSPTLLLAVVRFTAVPPCFHFPALTRDRLQNLEMEMKYLALMSELLRSAPPLPLCLRCPLMQGPRAGVRRHRQYHDRILLVVISG